MAGHGARFQKSMELVLLSWEIDNNEMNYFP